ncbi:MAG TPA: TlpA disulfide reductase family protein [Planctomycetaceae bacterium]|nr:TlpA disulfide reductase family protein [Planctomycetaceae bacterium]
MASARTTAGFVLSLGSLVLLSGCGGGEKTSSPAGSANSNAKAARPDLELESAESADGNTTPPAASIGSVPKVELKEGTPEWYLKQIQNVRGEPMYQANGETPTLEELRNARSIKNEKIIELATQIITLTHDRAEQAEYFNVAIQEFMEARLQNALQGDAEDIEALYSDAGSLQQRNPESEAAMHATYALARFAHTNAKRYASQDPRWIIEFSKQARLLASNFPREEHKVLPLLSSAAMTCELHGDLEEAKACYALLAEKFPETQQGRQSVGVLRRMQLEGKPLEFAGPTPDGGFISIDDFKNKVVLIVFWSSESQEFSEQLPVIKEAYEKYQKFGFEVVGVCMDEDEPALNAWLEEHPLPWKQIFFAEPEKRRWENPVAQYYGIREIPTMWLVDHKGVVQHAKIAAEQLDSPLRDLLLALREDLKTVSTSADVNP